MLIVKFFLCYFGAQIVGWNGWGWNGWEAISAIVLAVTIIIIAIQARATKKLAELSVMPHVSFTLRSKKTIHNRANNRLDLELPESMEMKEKLETLFIIQNNSKFPISFRVKTTFEINGRPRPTLKPYWDTPLPANPGVSQYPNVIRLKDFANETDDIQDKKITARIEYDYAPGFATEMRSKAMIETWIFDLKTYEWVGPAGMRDIMFFLPGESH